MWSLGITFLKVCEFTLRVILVLFATFLIATSDICPSLQALIAVTFLFPSLVFRIHGLE